MEKYPRWLKGHPWKGCRSLIAARGFKSLLLRADIVRQGVFEPAISYATAVRKAETKSNAERETANRAHLIIQVQSYLDKQTAMQP